MPTEGHKVYRIKPVDVSSFVIRTLFEADEENAPEWFEAQAQNYFVDNIIQQVPSIGVDELIDLPGDQNPIKDPDTGKLTMYFTFHGADEAFGTDIEDALAYVSILVDANTGEAYAIDVEAVE